VSHIDSDTIALIALGESGAPVDNEHIAQCPKCQSELDEFRSVVSCARSITDADRPATPPDSVWLGIETAITPSAAPSPGTPAKRNRGAGWYALAASVGVVIGGLATFIAMQSPTSTQTPSVIAQASLEPLRDVEQPAQAVVQQVNGQDVLVVQASGLPSTDGYYEVWLLAPDAQSMVSVGMLDSSEGGTFTLPAGLDLNQFPVVDISLEHFDGDTSHSADSILRGKLEI
jgi:hypothetical protein